MYFFDLKLSLTQESCLVNNIPQKPPNCPTLLFSLSHSIVQKKLEKFGEL